MRNKAHKSLEYHSNPWTRANRQLPRLNIKVNLVIWLMNLYHDQDLRYVLIDWNNIGATTLAAKQTLSTSNHLLWHHLKPQIQFQRRRRCASSYKFAQFPNSVLIMKNRCTDSQHELGRKLLNTGRATNEYCPLPISAVFVFVFFCHTGNVLCALGLGQVLSSNWQKFVCAFLSRFLAGQHILGGAVGANVLHVPANGWSVGRPQNPSVQANWMSSQLLSFTITCACFRSNTKAAQDAVRLAELLNTL